MKSLILVLFIGFVVSAIGAPALNKVSGGYDRPIDIGRTKHTPHILYVVEQNGKIIAINRESGKRLGTILDLSKKVSRNNNEEGLLGIAFDPKKAHTFYVNYTAGKKTHISRYQLDAKSLSAGAEERLLSFEQDFRNHNGGWLGFGPDGYLYIGIGDGGSGNDPKKRAQDKTNILGTIARIDVSPSKGYKVPKDNPFINNSKVVPEIYAYGLRNPWRCSFDRKTGDLWIADVGQNAHEEINFSQKGRAKGKNFGWRLREGKHATPKRNVGGAPRKSFSDPIYEYDHGSGKMEGRSVTGGFVYRGSVKELNGQYIFADYINRRIWSLTQRRGEPPVVKDFTGILTHKKSQLGPISSFAEDTQGELYLIEHSGNIYRITGGSP